MTNWPGNYSSEAFSLSCFKTPMSVNFIDKDGAAFFFNDHQYWHFEQVLHGVHVFHFI